MDKVFGFLKDALLIVAILSFIGFLLAAQFQMWNMFFDKF
jgi:hypothetical protein